jgi:hypothetical protein
LAFSAPIIVESEVVAVVAVTVDLGNFVDFDNQLNQYAMLVDNRPGDNRGIILEHPLFQEILATEGRLPDDLSRTIVDWSYTETANPADLFQDPVGRHSLGKAYNRPFIVGTADVVMLTTHEWHAGAQPQNSPGTPATLAPNPAVAQESHALSDQPSNRATTKTPVLQTGLVVMAMEDFESVVAPADNLIYQWGRLAAVAACLLLTISIGMWFFVRRLLQESREKLERVFSPAQTESKSIRTRNTLPVTVDRHKPTEET